MKMNMMIIIKKIIMVIMIWNIIVVRFILINLRIVFRIDQVVLSQPIIVIVDQIVLIQTAEIIIKLKMIRINTQMKIIYCKVEI